MADNVIFNNSAGFICSFNVQWDGGESDHTPKISNGETVTLDISTGPRPTPGTSCWVRAFIVAGPNHDSGRNFNFLTSDSTTVEYTVTGGTQTPSFD